MKVQLEQQKYSIVVNRSETWLSDFFDNPDSKVHGANMGPIWGLYLPFVIVIAMPYEISENLNRVIAALDCIWDNFGLLPNSAVAKAPRHKDIKVAVKIEINISW